MMDGDEKIQREIWHVSYSKYEFAQLMSDLRTYMSHGMRFQQCSICDQQSLRSACAYAQSGQSLCQSIEYSRSIKLLVKHHLEFLSLNGGCTGSSESTHVKMPHCWESNVVAQLFPGLNGILNQIGATT